MRKSSEKNVLKSLYLIKVRQAIVDMNVRQPILIEMKDKIQLTDGLKIKRSLENVSAHLNT